MKRIGKKRIKSFFESYGYFNADKGYVFTPLELATEMVQELPKSLFKSSTSTFLNGDCTASWTLLVAVVKRLKENGHSDENIKSRVWGFTPTPFQVQLIKTHTGLTHIYCTNFLTATPPSDIYMNMKFDAIVGNPPYNAPRKKKEGSETFGANSTLWDKFVKRSIDLIKPNGYLCLVHPSGWRSFTGRYEEIHNIYKENNLIYIRMSDAIQGKKVFGAGTSFDIVVCQKNQYEGKTTIIDYDGQKSLFNISDWKCIPSGMFNEVFSLIAKDGEPTCDMGHSEVDYMKRRKYIVSEDKKTKKHKYPVVAAVNTKGEPTLLYSSENKGMIGITKVIFGRRECGVMMDIEGQYACSQDTRYIPCTKEEAPLIMKAMLTEKFIQLMKYLSWKSTAPDKYDKNGVRILRKDFWKRFV